MSAYDPTFNTCMYCNREIYANDPKGCQMCLNCGQKCHKVCQNQTGLFRQSGGSPNFLACKRCGILGGTLSTNNAGGLISSNTLDKA